MSIIVLEHINALHFLLAFAGLFLHLLMKLEKARKKEGFTFGRFALENAISTVASCIIIPMMMIVCSEPAVSELVPITYVTSVLLGYQAHSFFKGVMDVAKKKVNTQEEKDE